MADKNDYREKINMAGGIPEKIELHNELIEMLVTDILALKKRIEKLENRSLKQIG